MQGFGVGAGLAALGFWIFLAMVVVAGIWYGLRERQAQHETLRHLIGSGQPLDPALREQLLQSVPAGAHGPGGSQHQLRSGGVVMLFIAPGLALLAWLGFGGPEADLVQVQRILYGVALMVGLIGVGLLVAAGGRPRHDDGGVGRPAHRAG